MIGQYRPDDIGGPGWESFTCFLAFLIAAGSGLAFLLRSARKEIARKKADKPRQGPDEDKGGNNS